ncbi:hypothetical protein [Rubrivirga sp. IMCC43871]|uniref:hypothetical protein n=1 Tax=Rubrivirga sp. IMCC43871 TaxID=3391575 RepID=UPI00398FAE7D
MSRLLLAATAALVLYAAPGAAQTERSARPVLFELPVSDAASPARPASRLRTGAPECDPASEGAVFEVAYTGFPTAAKAAFQAAVDTWACRIRTTQPIRIDASWASLDASTLGSAGPFLYRNFPGAPTRGVWYPAALADHLADQDLGDSAPDIEATFNSDFGAWHIGPGSAPSGLYDLTTVVLHEIGHGLGFIGALKVEEGVGRIGTDPEGPFSYDLHTQTPTGVSLLDADVFPNRSVVLADALQGVVHFVGRAIEQTVGQSIVPLYTPPAWVPGGSYSHLDEDTFGASTGDGLMTPFIARGEVISAPGPVVCAVLADVGWTLAGDCAEKVGPLPVTSARITAALRGRHPISGQTRVSIEASEAVSVRVTLVDVLGRRVADYGSAVLVGGSTLEVVVDGGPLAAGLYVLRVLGGPESVALPLVVVR